MALIGIRQRHYGYHTGRGCIVHDVAVPGTEEIMWVQGEIAFV